MNDGDPDGVESTVAAKATPPTAASTAVVPATRLRRTGEDSKKGFLVTNHANPAVRRDGEATPGRSVRESSRTGRPPLRRGHRAPPPDAVTDTAHVAVDLLYRPDGTVIAMGSARERILDAAEELITAGHVPPALDAVAATAGVSKGGLLYHFDKRSLLQALMTRAVQRFDERLTRAAAEGLMAAAWLRLSVPEPSERALYRAMSSTMRLTATGELDLPAEVADAEQRWQRMLTDELGDPVRARLVRLVGDGLFLAALTGPPPTSEEVEQLLRHLGLRTSTSHPARP